MSSSTNTFVTNFFDKIDVTYPDSTTEIFTYSLHGIPVEVIQITYVDSSKVELLAVEKLS